MWHFLAGQDAGQLLGTARGVFGRDHPDLQITLTAQRLLQGGNRFGFVIFDADQHPLSLQHPAENAAAFQHLGGIILHQAIVRGDVRLALCRIDNQGFYPAQAAFQFRGGREARATQARHTRIVNALHNIGARMLAIVRQGIEGHPAIFAIGRHKDAEFGQTGRMRGHVLANRINHPGGGRMNRQHTAGSKRQRLTAQHLIARRHADLAFMADMLF